MSVERARDLRKRMPPAEARLWNLLRNEQFKPFHFRRQVPLGSYFADFASHSSKLVIEVDGDTHGGLEAIKYDAERDRFIHSEGFDILRVTNRDVMKEPDGVTEMIMRRLTGIPTRPGFAGPPSPRGGGRSTAPAARKTSKSSAQRQGEQG